MEPLPTKTASLLAETTCLLKQILGSAAEIDAHEFLIRKNDYVVLRTSVRHPSLQIILKLAGPDAPVACPFEQSAYLVRQVAAKTTIPMAEVIAADASCRAWPWRYLILTHVAGIEWATLSNRLDIDERALIHAELGDVVAQLHSIAMPLFGEFGPTGNVVGCEGYLDALRARAGRTIKRDDLAARFFALLDTHSHLFADVGVATLCHEDLHKHNILVRQVQGTWKIATILDFDKAWAGCPESDLARMEFWDSMTSSRFWDAYGARRTVSSGYEARRPIYQLLWCLEYARENARHLDDTNRLCTTLGIDAVDSFL